MKKFMLMLMFVVGLFANEYKCVSVKKQIDGKDIEWKSDMLYGLENEHKLKIIIKNPSDKASGTFYNTSETIDIDKIPYKIFKNGEITIYISSKSINEKGFYVITLQTNKTLEGFVCLKSKD